MKTQILLRSVVLAWFLAMLGCNPTKTPAGGGGQSNQAATPSTTSNQRNLLLARLQDQDSDGKLAILMAIVQDDSDQAMRRDALSYLKGLGAVAEPLAEPLTRQLLVEQDGRVVGDIQEVLVELGSQAELFLVSASDKANERQWLRITETLGLTGASTPETIKLLDRQLASEDYEVVITTCQALERIGRAGHSVLPSLIAIAQQPRVPLVDDQNARAFRESRDAVGAAVRAILAVGADESAVSVLTTCLAMEPSIAAVAAAALADVGPKAQSSLAALEQLLNRDDHGGRDVKTRLARESASKAISAIKPEGN